MEKTELKDKIKSFFKGDVETDPETLEKYSRDASLFYIKPAVVTFPNDVEDVKNLVNFVREEKKNGNPLSITPRLAGTDMSGGTLSESIVMDMKPGFNHLKEVGKDYAVVEPGMYYRDFEKETLKHDLLLPSYPASRELCTIGGMVANNSGGEKTLSYGKTEDYVENIKMIMNDGQEHSFSKLTTDELDKKKAQNDFEGEVYRKMYDLIEKNQNVLQAAKPKVTKNSSGYFLWNVYNPTEKTFDLTKLIVGSQGTLGIITETKLRLIKPKPHSRLLIIFMRDLKDLGRISKTILGYKPESFESYDDNTFRLAFKFFPDIVKRIKGSIFRIALALLPEAFILATMGMPKLVLLAEFTAETEEEASSVAIKARDELSKSFTGIKARVTASKEETEEFWVIRRESFNLLRHHVQGLRTAAFIDDFSVPADKLTEFLPKLYDILGKYKLLYTIAGHIGDGNFHIIPLMKLADPGTKKIIRDLSDQVYKLVLEYKGSFTAEHNDGIIRTPFLTQEFGENIVKLFEETKKIFDPDGIFNPGKKTGGSLDYALSHLDMKV